MSQPILPKETTLKGRPELDALLYLVLVAVLRESAESATLRPRARITS